MISDHVKAVTKYPCSIITVNPVTKQVEGVMRAGPIHISVYTTDPLFRWPKVGENWIVKQENGTWYLDTILQDPNDTTLIQELEPGDAHINVTGKIHTNTGLTVTRKYVQVVGDGSKKPWTIAHNLNDLAVQVSAIATASPNAPITELTWAPVVLEGGAGDPNNLIITFTSAPALNGAKVVVIG